MTHKSIIYVFLLSFSIFLGVKVLVLKLFLPLLRIYKGCALQNIGESHEYY